MGGRRVLPQRRRARGAIPGAIPRAGLDASSVTVRVNDGSTDTLAHLIDARRHTGLLLLMDTGTSRDGGKTSCDSSAWHMTCGPDPPMHGRSIKETLN
jgi:hypothetical protein